MVLQNYLFFGNASSCLDYIYSMFDEAPDGQILDFVVPPKPEYLIIDFVLVTGLDTHTIDVLNDILAVCKREGCELMFSGLSPAIRIILAYGGFRPKLPWLTYYSDLESALGEAEDKLLLTMSNIKKKCEVPNMGPKNGLQYALEQIKEEQGVESIEILFGLERYTQPVFLKKGQNLYHSMEEDGVISDFERGILFIEHGLVRVERDPSLCTNRVYESKNKPCGTISYNISISDLAARGQTMAARLSVMKAVRASDPVSPGRHAFRLALVGPGWILGTIEGVSGMKNPGVHVAETDCRAHLLPYRKMQELENEDPVLALHLVKLMGLIIARKQENVIAQLGILQSIMTSPALKKPVNRVTLGALSKMV